MTLEQVFPNINKEIKYMFVGINKLNILNKHKKLKEKFRQKFPYYVQGNIYDNYIFFPSQEYAIDFIRNQSYWWSKHRTKEIKIFFANHPRQLIYAKNEFISINYCA